MEGFPHVVAAEAAKAARDAQQAEVEKMQRGCGLGAPRADAPLADCARWSEKFFKENMIATPDGITRLKDSLNITKDNLTDLYARVKNWSNNGSACPDKTKVKEFLRQLALLRI